MEEEEGGKEANSQGRAAAQGPPLILSVAAAPPAFSPPIEQVRDGHTRRYAQPIIPLCEGSGPAGLSEEVRASAEEGGMLCTAAYTWCNQCYYCTPVRPWPGSRDDIWPLFHNLLIARHT